MTISDYDPSYKVIYLGNVLTPWAKGEQCVEKPLATLWKNYCSNVKREIYMKVTICNSGLKAVTHEHGLTEYWSNRVTFCYAHPSYPKVFCWVYRHEGRKMKQELRCHAVLCAKESKAKDMAIQLSARLTSALAEFRREKRMRQNSKVQLATGCRALLTSNLPMRKKHLVKGCANFRPPLERSRSAPKLSSIDEFREEEEEQLEQDEEEADELADYIRSLDQRSSRGGSLTSDVVETVSDLAFESDDLDSVSERLVSNATDYGESNNQTISASSHITAFKTPDSADCCEFEVLGDPRSLNVTTLSLTDVNPTAHIESTRTTPVDSDEEESTVSAESGYSDKSSSSTPLEPKQQLSYQLIICL